MASGAPGEMRVYDACMAERVVSSMTTVDGMVYSNGHPCFACLIGMMSFCELSSYRYLFLWLGREERTG